MELKKLFAGEGIPGPYNRITHFPIVNKELGYDQMEVIFSTTEKGNVGSLHNHPNSEHVMIVIEGSIRINTDKEGEHYDLLPGYALCMHPGEYHEVVNTYDGTTKYMVIYAPQR